MQQQQEADSFVHKQEDSTYRGYQGEQKYMRQYNETSYEQASEEEPAQKVYPEVRASKNNLRLTIFVIAMVTLVLLAVLSMFVIGGTGGWISFCASCLVIFIVAVVAIDKIE